MSDSTDPLVKLEPDDAEDEPAVLNPVQDIIKEEPELEDQGESTIALADPLRPDVSKYALDTSPPSAPLWKQVHRCQICEQALAAKEVNITPKGLRTLLAASEARQDNKFPPGFLPEWVYIHLACRKYYTNEAKIKSAIKKRLKSLNVAAASKDVLDTTRGDVSDQTDALDLNGSEAAESEMSWSEPAASEAMTPKTEKPESTKPELGPVGGAAPGPPADIAPGENKPFDYLEQCLFCGERAWFGRRGKCQRISSADTGDRIYRASLDNSTPFYKEVRKRIKDKDLVALHARYHLACYASFLHPHKCPPGAHKRGRPCSEEVSSQMESIYNYVENNWEDSQFTTDDIFASSSASQFTAVRKLAKRYGGVVHKRNNIVITPLPMKVLEENWHEQKLDDEKSERLRIVRTAANIVLEDIRAELYNTTQYSTSSSFLKEVNSVVPETLRTFMETVVTKYKKNPECLDNTVTALSHSVMAAARPRSFRSPLLLGIGSLIHQKYASKTLIDLLSSVGFCAPYKEVTKFEMSAAFHSPQGKRTEFTQFVFDSVEGTTGHSLVGVKCDTPSAEKPIRRLDDAPANFSYGEYREPLKYYINATPGLTKVTIADHRDDTAILPTRGDALWLFGKTDPSLNLPSWDAFMNKMTRNSHPVSEIHPLPIIDAPPSYDSIYTALKQAKMNTKGTCFVTFDQPMYQKAQEIINSKREMCNVVLRLGGFDVVRSFLGVIGYIMSGSGLKELWCSIYAAQQTEKMMTGHAYARAVRAHFLTRSALFNIITKDFDLTPDERLEIEGILEGDSMPQSENESRYQDPLTITLELLEKRGATAQLWVQYFRMTTLVAQFIEAEKTADWCLHLLTLKRMLPYFHAGGHLDYAKSCSLYLQDMQALDSKCSPEEYESFTKKGYFAVKWTEKQWADDWSDRVVEQTMGMMKRPGGITNGTKVTDSFLSMWLRACPVLSKLAHLVVDYCRPNEEVEGSKHQDDKDAAKLKSWFEENNPFPEVWDLVSLTGPANKDATCHEAEETGKLMMAQTISQNYLQVIYQVKKKVRPLSLNIIQVDNVKVPIEPDTILKRIPITKKHLEMLKKFFKYELAPYPLSLFDDKGMLEANKSSLFELFVPLEVGEGTRSHVVDGEFLLHRVSWKDGATVSAIAYAYVDYVKTNFANAVVVFGGNKAPATSRNVETKSPVVEFQKDTVITVSQENFLSNQRNRERFIQYLMIEFTRSGVKIKVSSNDVHLNIVQTALINSSTYDQTCLVSDNADLLIRMCGLANNKYIYFMKPGRGFMKPPTYYQRDSLEDKKIQRSILFLHAVSGCDSTSAIFGQGKIQTGLTISGMPSKDVKELASVFTKPTSDKLAIVEAGEKFIRHLYGDVLNKLNVIRYNKFAESVTRSRYDLARLPPSEGAVRQHMYRTYHQVQKWLGNNLPPTDWGWKFVDNRLEPIMTLDDVAPKELLDLDMISCKCDGLCSGRCVCKRANLECCVLCVNCNGKSCHGIEMDVDASEAGTNTLLRCDAFGNPVDPFENNNDNCNDDDDDDKIEQPEPTTSRAKRVRRDATLDKSNDGTSDVEQIYIIEDPDS